VILEHALLPVRPDRQAEFDAAFARAKPLVAGMPGFRGLSLSRCLEDDGTYLLLVEWDSLADPTIAIAQLAARVVPLEREACAALAGSRTATSAVTP
jgi:antibiotic biosynthesis monooxygenase (ABM) superfamily enzyme